MLVYDPRRPNRLQRTLGRPLLSGAARIDSTAAASFETAAIALDFPASVQHGGGADLTAHCPPFRRRRTQALGLLRQRPVAKPNLVDSPIRRRRPPNPFSSNPRTSPRQKGNTSERCVGVVEQLGSDET